MSSIKYKKLNSYKYLMMVDYVLPIPLKPASDILTEYIGLTTEGVLTIRKDYAWDGPSGPTIDTTDFMRGSLVHDALYQLIRMGFLKQSDREEANNILRTLCREDGMSFFRAFYVYHAVQMFGSKATALDNGHGDDFEVILSAP